MKRTILLLLTILLFIISCDINKPVFPQWDVNLKVPLMNKSFFVSDLVDSVNIVLGDDDVLNLRSSGFAQTQENHEIPFFPHLNVSNAPLLSGITQNISLPISDAQNQVELWYAEISRAQLKVRFNSILPELEQAQLTFEDIVFPDGNAFQIEYNGSLDWLSFSLAGCRVGNADLSAAFEQISIALMVQSSLSDGSYLGSVDIKLEDGLYFSEFDGRLYDYHFPSLENSGTIDIEYPENLENTIRLLEASLKLNIQNELGFSCELQGEIKAQRTDTLQEVFIPLEDENGNNLIIWPADENGPGSNEIIITKGISKLMQIMPHKISLENLRFKIRDDLMPDIGSLRSTDTISCHYQVDVPFKMILYSSYLKLQDPIELQIDEDNRNLIQNNILNADLGFLLLNQLPIGCQMQMLFSTKDELDHQDPSSYLLKKEVFVHSKQWVESHPDAPNVNALGEQILNLNLNQEEMKIFSHPKLYLSLIFSFEESGEPITITASAADYIKVKSMMQLNVHISEDI